MTQTAINLKLLVLFISTIILLLNPHTVISQLRNKRFQTARVSETKQLIFPITGKKIQRLNSVEICYGKWHTFFLSILVIVFNRYSKNCK